MNHKIYLLISSFSLYFFAHHLEKKIATSPARHVAIKAFQSRGRFCQKGFKWWVQEWESSCAGELGWVQSSLANIGVKKLSKLEKEKEAAAAAIAAGQDPWQRGSKAPKTLKTSENTWGGLSLGASLKRHQSKLQLEQVSLQTHHPKLQIV